MESASTHFTFELRLPNEHVVLDLDYFGCTILFKQKLLCSLCFRPVFKNLTLSSRKISPKARKPTAFVKIFVALFSEVLISEAVGVIPLDQEFGRGHCAPFQPEEEK